jgi:streptomycin 6-kinase
MGHEHGRRVRIPAGLEQEWRRESEWLQRLPALVHECAEQWGLELGEPFETPHSLVLRAGDHVLKLNAPSHVEAEHEADALEAWAGNGAARLVARDDAKRALLIERCRPGTPLAESAVDHRSVVVDLLQRLWIEAGNGHPFRLMRNEAERWAEEVPRFYDAAGRPFEQSLVALAVDVFRSSDANADVLVNQDLHGGNVLKAQREPWLVIDPKPAIGEREVSAVGLLRNAAWRGGVGEVRRWLAALEDLGLDRERLRGWGVAHTLAWGWDTEGRWSPRAIHAARTIAAA